MKKLTLAIVMVSVLISIATTAQRLSSPQAGQVSPATPVAIGGSNLPFQPIGASDLVRLTVDDSPELSQTFRVDQQGNLNLPLLNQPIPAAGLMPNALRDEIAATLKARHLLVNPVVDVSVVEYRSRDVTIAGAVKTPMTIQELGGLRVLGAISQAGGLLPEAGPEIIVEQANGSVQRISVRAALRRASPSAQYPCHRGFADPGAGMRTGVCCRRCEAPGSISFSGYAGHHGAQIAGPQRRP